MTKYIKNEYGVQINFEVALNLMDKEIEISVKNSII